MAKDITPGNWGQPKYSAGEAPELGVDETQLSDYYAPMVARRFSTYALAYAAVPPGNGYSARGDDAPGLVLIRVAGAWKPIGVGQFADAAARNTAITTPIVGMRTRLATEQFDREYVGTSWLPMLERVKFKPTVALQGAGSQTTSDDGRVELSGVGTSFIVRAFPTGFRGHRLKFDLTSAAACLLTAQLVDGSGNPITTASYDTGYMYEDGNASVSSYGHAGASPQTTWKISQYASATRFRFDLEFSRLVEAARTSVKIEFSNTVDGGGVFVNGRGDLYQRDTTGYFGIKVILSASTVSGSVFATASEAI